MSDGDDILRRIESELLTLVRRAFDAGSAAERNRLILMLGASASVNPSSSHPVSQRRPRVTGYGAVSGPVKRALVELARETPDGVDARTITEHFQRIGSGPNERQVRAALKTLTNTGEAVRASRGRYSPREATTPSSRENPDADTSGHLHLAA